MKKQLFFAVFFMILLLVLAGCGGAKEEDQEGAEPQQDQQQQEQPSEPAEPGVPEGAANWKDGSFEGQSAKDEREAYGTITVVIEGGKITSADYEEIQKDGTPKGPDYQYQTSVEAQPVYEERLVESQDPEKVEVVTGATATWNKFKEATKAALNKATE